MSAQRAVHEEVRRIGVDTVAVVQLFSQRRYAEASLRTAFIAAAAQRAGLRRIQDAAAVLKVALRPSNRATLNSVDSGLTQLVEEVERASIAYDSVHPPTETAHAVADRDKNPLVCQDNADSSRDP